MVPSWIDKLMRRSPYDQNGVAAIGPRRIYILPTSTGVTFGAMCFATLLGSLNYQNNLGLFLTFLMAGVALVSMHHCWYNLLGLSVRCADAEPSFSGQPVRFQVEVWNPHGRQHREVCLRGGDCTTLADGAHAKLELALPTERRGPMHLGELLIDTRYPLGLFRAWALVCTPAQALIYPRPARRAPPPGLGQGPDRETHQTRSQPQGRSADDFVGLRAYHPGDSPRQIDWKALAREQGLLTKQFGGDQAAHVQLDLNQHSGDLEHRLSLLTRQVLDADARQLRYGLSVGNSRIPCGRGETHKRQCLEALACYQPTPASKSGPDLDLGQRPVPAFGASSRGRGPA